MEMLREIDEETVDFIPNYDGRVQEPTVLPSRFPNLLANGSGGIAVGMATNMPPHNLRELSEAVFWCLDNFEADEEDTLAAVTERVKGPDFPTYGLIVGSQGILDAYTTGRGSIRMRGVVEVEEDSKGRTLLVITELPYQVNHDNFITSIADQVRDGKLAGISNIEDQGSDRVGMRIVVEVKRDAVAKVVLNNLYKHTQLQTSFGANMLSIVDGVPRTLRIDQLIRLYVVHQLDVIVRRTIYRLRKANERAHILRGLVKALDALDEVIALIRGFGERRRRPRRPDRAARRRRHSGAGDPRHAAAAPCRTGTSAHRRRPGPRSRPRSPTSRTFSPSRNASARSCTTSSPSSWRSTATIAARASSRPTARSPTRTSSPAKKSSSRSPRPVTQSAPSPTSIAARSAAARAFRVLASSRTTSSGTSSSARPTTGSCSSPRRVGCTGPRRTSCRRRPERRAGSTWRTCWPSSRRSASPRVIQIKSYEDAPYLVLATKNGLVKKSKLTDFDSNRSGGIVAVNLRDGDELVGAVLCSAEEDLLLVSAKGQSIRFSATDEALRPMGRATSGVQGMRFNDEDQLLSLNVVREGTYLLVATSGGYSKRTAIEEYTPQGRGGKGILTIQYDRRRGTLVGALIVDEDTELYAITSGGGVIRTVARQVRKAGRQTKGVRLMNLGDGDTLIAVARNADEDAADDDAETDAT